MKEHLLLGFAALGGVLVSACSTLPPAANADQLLAGTWVLTRVNDQPVPGGVSLYFDGRGTLHGSVTCNSLSARYRLTAGRLLTDEARITERGCVGTPGILETVSPTLLQPSKLASFEAGREYLVLTGAKRLTFRRS